LHVNPDAVAAPFVNNQKNVVLAGDFGVIAADAFAVEHDVVFAVSPDARHAPAQRVGREAAGADQGQARVERVLVLDRLEVGGGDRFDNDRLVNDRFVLGGRRPLATPIFTLRDGVVFQIRTPDPGGDEFFGNGLED